jgi:hypothetical protein
VDARLFILSRGRAGARAHLYRPIDTNPGILEMPARCQQGPHRVPGITVLNYGLAEMIFNLISEIGTANAAVR